MNCGEGLSQQSCYLGCVPFTPFHMGPGLVCKAAMGRRLSVVAFGWSQIVMDLQPLVAMIRHTRPLHGWSHTYAASLGLGLASTGTFWAMSRIADRSLERLGLEPAQDLLAILRQPWSVILVSSLIGTISHVLLDSVMHMDMRPYTPLLEGPRPLLGLLTVPEIYQGCVLCGAIGGPIAAWRWWKELKAEQNSKVSPR